MVKCSKCGFENPDNFKFCGECGSKIIKKTVKKSEPIEELNKLTVKDSKQFEELNKLTVKDLIMLKKEFGLPVKQLKKAEHIDEIITNISKIEYEPILNGIKEFKEQEKEKQKNRNKDELVQYLMDNHIDYYMGVFNSITNGRVHTFEEIDEEVIMRKKGIPIPRRVERKIKVKRKKDHLLEYLLDNYPNYYATVSNSIINNKVKTFKQIDEEVIQRKTKQQELESKKPKKQEVKKEKPKKSRKPKKSKKQEVKKEKPKKDYSSRKKRNKKLSSKHKILGKLTPLQLKYILLKNDIEPNSDLKSSLIHQILEEESLNVSKLEIKKILSKTPKELEIAITRIRSSKNYKRGGKVYFGTSFGGGKLSGKGHGFG